MNFLLNNFRKIIIVLLLIYWILSLIFGIEIPYWGVAASLTYLDTGDNEEVSLFKGESSDKERDSKDYSSDKESDSKYFSFKGKSPEFSNQEESSPNQEKSTDKDFTSPFPSRTIISPDSGGPSPYDDIQKRLERIMLDHTQGFLNKGDQEIKSKGLQFKDEADLTLEDKELLESRDKDAKFLAETSANLSKLELKGLSKDSNSMDIDSKKRFLEESSDNNPNSKKSK